MNKFTKITKSPYCFLNQIWWIEGKSESGVQLLLEVLHKVDTCRENIEAERDIISNYTFILYPCRIKGTTAAAVKSGMLLQSPEAL